MTPVPPDGEILHEVAWDHDLRRTPEGRLLLTVLCGTVGLYEVIVELTAAERAAWEAEGPAPVVALARAIASEPGRFAERAQG